MKLKEMIYYCSKLWEILQHSWIYGIFCALIAYFTDIGAVFIAIIVAFTMDLIVGITASLHSKIPISSKRLRKTIAKGTFYLSFIMLLFVFEKQFDIEWFMAHKAVGVFICYVEALSILESWVIITDGDKRVVTILRWVRGKAADKFGSIADDLTKEKNE